MAYSDSRTFGYQGPTRNVRLYRALPSGGGAISKCEDGLRCAITGKESLRIVQLSDGTKPHTAGHKSSLGRGGHRIDASRNLWEGSGLKIDCASTDVAWGHGVFNNKILTSARNGELIMWDINKTGPSKYERRSKDHIRSINTLSVSHIVHHYCITGSADGDMRVWDLRDMSRSLMRVHHPTSVRSVVFSPSTWQPLHAVVGLDNGSIYRWDLKMGQRGLLDRLPVAHTASVTTLDWCNRTFNNPNVNPTGVVEGSGNGLGWLVSGGLDRCVKVWNLSAPGVNTRIPSKPTYTLHPSFPVRRVSWRPSYQCELAVVSNAEFSAGSNQDLAQGNVVGGSDSGDTKASTLATVSGDAVEIWDVRRGWIPKWSVAGSASDGGVTDLVFGDADAIWTQHSSGTFSQIDLRHCTKPLDAITRCATTWEASGSLVFVAEAESPWQVPYDDLPIDKRNVAEKRGIKWKALGDRKYKPLSQDMGILVNDEAVHELEVFKSFAQGYIIHGENRSAICVTNAQVALQERRDQIAQTWLLLSETLNELIPPPQTTLPKQPDHKKPPFSQSASAPATMPTGYAFPASGNPPSQLRKPSPGQASAMPPRSVSTSTSRKITPASSNASSPRQMTNALPPLTPRRSSFFGGREFAEADLSRRSSVSFNRRPSLSACGSHSISPGERAGGGSLRHVGEGALDDSDSSSTDGSDEDPAGGESSDEESALQPLFSPIIGPIRGIPAPSPLSRVAGQHRWSGDESQEKEDESVSSPSPRSTDTESVRSNSPPRKTKSASRSSKRHSTRMKSRSRSSTVASLAAPPTRSLIRQDSHSSIRTVTAGEVSFAGQEDDHVGVKAEETMRDVRETHNRHQSVAMSEFALDVPPVAPEEQHTSDPDLSKLTDRRIELICVDEKRFKDISWAILKEALEQFADEGDVQMCAMLAVVAPKELGISRRRVSRFLESYIELLTRRQLHACSAYLRKYCQIEDFRNLTLLETTIYTTCGRCRKPLSIPAGTQVAKQVLKGGFAYCLTCKKFCVSCVVCRLPVRTLLIQCSVCSHGGHQACIRAYYMHHPMMDLPGACSPHIPDPRIDISRSRNQLGGADEDVSATVSVTNADSSTEISPQRMRHRKQLTGYPCAAGCGHFCWATNVDPEDT